MTPSTKELAESAARRATDTHTAEVRRLQEAQTLLDNLTEQFETADPDSAAFARLVSQRDAVRARVDALALRERKACRTAEAAKEELAAAERAAHQVELAQLDAEIGKLDAAITAEVDALRGYLAEKSRDLRALVGRANVLDRQLGERPAIHFDRGAFWVRAVPGHELRMAALHPRILAESQQSEIIARVAAAARGAL